MEVTGRMIASINRTVISLVFSTLMCTCAVYGAQPLAHQIQVSGILGKKVIVVVDGKQHIIEVGKTTPEGIKVNKIDGDGAELEIEGQSEYFPLGSSRVSTTYIEPSTIEERVYKDTRGMFRTVGTINGLPVNFLVDTGATAVALNRNEAKRLGIDYLVNGDEVYAGTASGVTKAYKVKLASITVGKIKMTNIDAMVIDSDSPLETLLGMTFLGKLNIQHTSEVMVLETK